MVFTPKRMSEAFTHSWSLVKEEPCSNCGSIDPDGVYECEGCQQGFCQNCMDDGGLYGAAHDRYFDTRLSGIDMTRSKLADEYMNFQGSIESGANNMCRNCVEEYENSEPGAIEDAKENVIMESDDEIDPLFSLPPDEPFFGDRQFPLNFRVKNASNDVLFESAWSVVK